jgi:hypothetical protein
MNIFDEGKLEEKCESHAPRVASHICSNLLSFSRITEEKVIKWRHKKWPMMGGGSQKDVQLRRRQNGCEE